MKNLALALLAAIAVCVLGCGSAPKPRQPAYSHEWMIPPLAWPQWPTNEPQAVNAMALPPATNLFVPVPPLLQLPEQKVARDEIEKSDVSPELLQKMLQGRPLKLEEIEQLTQKSVSETNIVKYLRSTGAVYLLSTKEVNGLQQARVSEAVIDYLLRTPTLYRDSALLYRFYYSPALYYPGYWPWHHYDYHHGYYHPSHHPSHWGHDSHHH